MVEVEDGIAGTSEGIILEATDGEVTGGVEERLRQGAIEFPSIRTFLEAVDIAAAEEEFNVLGAHLVGPEKIDVARQTAGIVVEGLADGGGQLIGGDAERPRVGVDGAVVSQDVTAVGSGEDTDGCQVGSQVGRRSRRSYDRVYAKIDLQGDALANAVSLK